jgi:transcription factor SPN1
MLNEVVDMLNRKDMQRTLLELDVLVVCKRWIQPLPNGRLGNVTVRQRLLHVIAEMKGDNGITPNDLKRSEFGKVIMILFKHPSETPTLKRQCKALVEQWSRPIFQKSGNMRDLERVHHLRGEGTGGLASIRRQQAQVEAATARAVMMQQRSRTGGGPASNNKDLQSIIASGKKGGSDGPASANRVRVPFSKGFAFSVRPEVRADVQQQQQAGGGGGAAGGGAGAGKGASPSKDGNRGKLSKRMLEKSRTKAKNERSANISVVGRRNKG